MHGSSDDMIPISPIALDPLPHFPLVSILVSNYNYANYLGEAIDSVLGQTYQNFEIVICDDGSTDSSREILKRYQRRDSRIKAIYQENRGQSLALTAAFLMSTGEIVCFLDADDIFLPDKLRMLVDAFAAAPESGFAVNRMLLVDKVGKCLAEMPCLYDLPSGWQGPRLSPTGPLILPGLPPTSGLSLRRSVARALFPLPAALKAYSDTVIQVVAPLMTPIVAVDTPLSEYRVHDANVAGVSRFTECLMQTIVLYNREIWSAWRRYISSACSGIPLPIEKPPSLMDYVYARFRPRQDFKAIYKAIPRAYFEELPTPHRWYWRLSVMLPNWLFRRSFDFVYGQRPSKMFARRIVSAIRCGVTKSVVAGRLKEIRACWR